jgi:Cu+-exporting ATPase
MAIFDQRFHYFCNRTTCRAAFLGEPAVTEPALTPVRRDGMADEIAARRAEMDAPIVDAFPPVTAVEALPDVPATDDDRLLVEPIGQTIMSEEPYRLDAADPRDIGALLLVIAVIAGSLAVTLALAGDTRLVIGARIVLAGVGASMLVGRAVTTARDVNDPHPVPILAPPSLALGVAVWAALGPDRALGAEAASLAGIIVTTTAVGAWIVETARSSVAAERAWVAAALAVPGRRAPEPDGRAAGETGKNKVFDIRPGEQVLVEPGETVPVDLTVTGGDVDVFPWAGATTQARRRNGDAVVAGARVVRGKLRGVCTFAGNDRAFARVLLDPRRRADALAPVAHAAQSLAERWAVAAAVVGAIASVVARRAPIEVAMTAVAVHAALATSVIAAVPPVHVLRGILLGLRRGIVYKSADAWDRAGRVVTAMFCARGTLLLGEPEVAELEAIGSKVEPSDVLALAAGAERAQEHPIATAILRAARTRGLPPDGVRNATMLSGLGVTAITSGGEDLCVGNRSLMLEKRISIAATEERIAELESLGRTVVLVAVGSRLVGLLGLQDGLRPGARAAVQHLLDAQIEPVLMSGDARETCEAIGRSLDIDHIRPEVLPADRGAEVKRLIEAGASVAVLGHAGVDDGALGAADVSVALGAAGSPPGDFAVALASEDVRDAALSLALAHRTRLEGRVGLALAVVPALVGTVAISFGVLPQAYAPIAALLGGVMAVVHVRSLR